MKSLIKPTIAIFFLCALFNACNKNELLDTESVLENKGLKEYVDVAYSINDSAPIIFEKDIDSLISQIEQQLQQNVDSNIYVEQIVIDRIENTPVLMVTTFNANDGKTTISAVELVMHTETSEGEAKANVTKYSITIVKIQHSISCISKGCGDGQCKISREGGNLHCTKCPKGNCTQNESYSQTIFHYVYTELR